MALFVKPIFQICFLGPRKYIRLINPGGYGEDLEFEDVSHLKNHKSEVWKNFLLNRIYSVAKCQQCLRVFRVTKGTTSTLRRHFNKCSVKLHLPEPEIGPE